MTAPVWMNAVIRDFGHAAGVEDLTLNDRGVVVLKFETGVTLRLEYTSEEELVMAVSVAGHGDTATLKRLLSVSHYRARYGFRLRTGRLAKSGSLVIAVRLASRDVTLPHVNAAFSVLWRLAGEIGGVA